MAFEHWWVGAFPNAVEVSRFKPEFDRAAAMAVPSEAAMAALEAWRRCPSDFEQTAVIDDAAATRVHAFIWAFNLPGFDRLAEQFLSQHGQFGDFLTEHTAFRMAITARTTPVSIVWHALGEERASLLPGCMGNMLLGPGEIDAALTMTRRAYAGMTMQSLLDTARRYCSANVGDEAVVEILNFLPDGLARASERGHGFLSLARPQL